MGGVHRDPVGEPSERQWAGGYESRVFSAYHPGSHEPVGPPTGIGLKPLRPSKTAGVQTSLSRRCGHSINGTQSEVGRFAETSDSSAGLRRIRAGIGKKGPMRPCNLIVW